MLLYNSTTLVVALYNSTTLVIGLAICGDSICGDSITLFCCSPLGLIFAELDVNKQYCIR